MPRKTIQKNLAYDTERQLYYAVFRQDGRRYTRTYRTREEAQAALEGNSCADRRLPGKDCTLGEWLTFWLEEVVARDRAESTLYAYRNMARCHVLPALGRIPLAELTPLRIQGYLYEKMNQGLSPNTVIKHYVMLTTALGMAVRLEMLERSPMDRVTPPKKKEARFSFYSPEQLQLLFSAVSGTMMELPVKLAAYLGLRRSEICGLRWENVDLEAGLLSIREVRTEVGGSVVLKSPKTRTSARRLGITGLQDLQQVLRRAWERRRSDDPKEWVVLRQDGAPPKPDQLTRDLLTVVRRQGLPKISLHGLRHSFASVANSQGVPMFDISRTLGHSSSAARTRSRSARLPRRATAARSGSSPWRRSSARAIGAAQDRSRGRGSTGRRPARLSSSQKGKSSGTSTRAAPCRTSRRAARPARLRAQNPSGSSATRSTGTPWSGARTTLVPFPSLWYTTCPSTPLTSPTAYAAAVPAYASGH